MYIKLSAFILIIFLFNCSKSTAQTRYPSYKEVLNTFFEQYSIVDLANYEKLHFAKRPEGWSVYITKHSDSLSIIKNEELFWDRTQNTFLSLSFKKASEFSAKHNLKSDYTDDFQSYYYKICPYYGYPNWEKDVMAEFASREELSDTLTIALGFAYSSYASNILHNYEGYQVYRQELDLNKEQTFLTDKQLNIYRNYRHRAIEQFEKVSRISPMFQTIVGNVSTKAANEYLTSFLDLLVFQNENEARKELKDDLYSEFMIATAKNFLISCEPNAIIFTNGDNDTYPLLYVQAQYGFRTDTLVANISLLNDKKYINRLRDKIMDAAPLPLSISQNDISGHKRDLIAVKNIQTTPINISDLILFIKDNSNLEKVFGKEMFFCPTNKFYLPYNEDKISWETNKQYLRLNELIILDILAQNKWVRPIYFAVTTSNSAFLGLDDYLQMEGLAFKLTPVKKEKNKDTYAGKINTFILYNNMMNRFYWGDLTNSDFELTETKRRIIVNYRNSFARLANALLDEGKVDSAVLVLNKAMSLMPDELAPFDYFVLPIADAYYRAGKTEKANSIMYRLAEIFSAKLEAIYSLDKTAQESMYLEKQQYLYILNSIVQSANRENQRELLNFAKPLFEYYFGLYMNK